MGHIKLALEKALRGTETVELVLATSGLVLCSSLIFVQVVNRYLLHFRIMWLGDLALYTFIGFMFISAAVCTWKEGHIAIDFFHDKAFNGKPRGIAIHRASIVFITIVVVVIFLPQAYQYMMRAFKYPIIGTLVTWFNISWLQELLFVAFALVLIHLVVLAQRDTANAIKTWRSKPRGKN